MTKEQLKTLLEDYWFDNQYLKEKSKEMDSITKMLTNSGTSKILSDSIQYEEEQIKLIINKKRYIESLIQRLRQPYKTVIYMKYVVFLTFDQIASRMNYSTKRIYQLHNEAITNLLENINQNDLTLS